MRALISVVAVVAVVIVVDGCRSANLALNVTVPAGHENDVLRAFVFTPGPGFKVDCDAISFADVTFDQLASSLVVTSSLNAASGDLGSVPRSGLKLIVVEGFADAASQVPTLFGCSDVGPIDDDKTVAVTLAPTASVAVVGNVLSLTADVPSSGKAALSQPLAVVVRTADGALANGHDVRVRLLVSSVSTEPAQQIVTFSSSGTTGPAGGGMALPIEIDRLGVFAVEVRARGQIGAPLPPIAGLALPSDDNVDPFAGTSPAPPAIVPGPIGGEGFVGIGGPLRVSVVHRGRSNVDPPTFTVTSPLPSSSSPASAVLTFATRVTGIEQAAIAIVLLADSTIAVVTADSLVASSPPIANVCAAVPIGDCAIAASAMPLLISAIDANGDCSAFAVADIGGNGALTLDPSPVASSAVRGLGVRFSVCARDPGDSEHRFLVASAATPGSTPELIDATNGIDGPHEAAPDLGVVFAFADQLFIGAPALTAARFAGTVVAVGGVRLALTQPALFPDGAGFDLPAPPTALFATGVALLAPSPAQPMILAVNDGGTVTGLHPLSACGPGTPCTMFADLDVLYVAGKSAHFISLISSP